ncbi:MAG: SH3 domain-containing protein [Anaerolineales bacterium]|nr:SH3 domain-containing protein [Anaerolineales bacterium]
MTFHRIQHSWLAVLLIVAALSLSGCGFFGGGDEEQPTAEAAPPRTLVPTFTPTPVQAVQPAASTPEPTQAVLVVDVAPQAAVTLPVTASTTVSNAAPVAAVTATPALPPSLEVADGIVNVRPGPGTNYGLVGTANQGERFPIVGRNAEKTWYKICCVNGQEGWVNAELTDEDNEELAVVVDTPAAPAAPVAQAPEPAAPAPPAAEATATPAPAPPPADDPCAGIGGDGCKFKLRNGPAFAQNGGNELKFQIHFIHSGVSGGQPQGSYFVWVEKDGQKLPISDGTQYRPERPRWPLGKYNYEYKVGRDQLPGNNVAGNYAIWVLDGNGERDSKTFSFTVPDGQGEVWIEFDQG